MENILGVVLPFTFEEIYLGKENKIITNSGDQYMLRIMLIASKKAITRKWLKTEVPKMDDWVKVMHNIYTVEKLTFAFRL